MCVFFPSQVSRHPGERQIYIYIYIHIWQLSSKGISQGQTFVFLPKKNNQVVKIWRLKKFFFSSSSSSSFSRSYETIRNRNDKRIGRCFFLLFFCTERRKKMTLKLVVLIKVNTCSSLDVCIHSY